MTDQHNTSPREDLKRRVVQAIAPKWSGLVHNQDDGTDSAERAFDSVVAAIKETGGVVLMPIEPKPGDEFLYVDKWKKSEFGMLRFDGQAKFYVNVLEQEG